MPKPGTAPAMSSRSIARFVLWLDGSGIWVGAHRIGGGSVSDVCPAWVTCPMILAPCAWTSSTIARYAGIQPSSQALM